MQNSIKVYILETEPELSECAINDFADFYILHFPFVFQATIVQKADT